MKKIIWIIVVVALIVFAVTFYSIPKDPEMITTPTPAPTPTPIVGENPAGEADPSRMKLDMKTWEWQSALYNDGTEIKARDPQKFTITFKNDGTFSASTDCNGIGGNYKVTGKQIVFSEMLGTLMYCEGSQEADFRKILENTSSYFFTSRGQLIFELKFDSGTATFL